ncbi:MAG: hypothetical protein IT342_02495 [Candidatus Melainabacteria bacterium]|nr:hypothetical protein [Candidatus Melainabacteria bacterium]
MPSLLSQPPLLPISGTVAKTPNTTYAPVKIFRFDDIKPRSSITEETLLKGYIIDFPSPPKKRREMILTFGHWIFALLALSGTLGLLSLACPLFL